MSIVMSAPEAAVDTTASLFDPAFAAFARVTAALETASSVDDLLRVVAREVADLVGVSRCSIQLREEDGELFRGRVGSVGERSIDAEVRRSSAGWPADGLMRELVQSLRPVIVANARTDPRMLQGTVRFWDIRSMMSVPMVSGGIIIGIIRLDEPGQAKVFSPADADLASVFARLAAVAVTQAQAKLALAATAEAARRQADALRRAAAVADRLSALLLDGASLQALVGELARIVGKPCAVYDAKQVRLAAATPDAGDGMLPRVLEPPASSLPEVQAALAAASEAAKESGCGRGFLVGPLPEANLLHRYLVVPVGVQSEAWGWLVVMEHKRRISGADMLTLRRAGTMLALQMSVERRAVEADWDAGASLTAELVTMGRDSSGARRRAERLGLRLETPRVVAYVASRTNRLSAGDFRSVLRAFAEVAPDLRVHAAAATGGVAVIIDVDRGGADALKGVLRDVVQRLGDDVVAGLSSVCSDGCGYAEAYAAAREIVECIRRFAPAGGADVFSAADLGSGRVLLATSDRETVRRFAETTFGSLVCDASKGDLLATLRMFFDNMASIRRCAARLGVHENTIRYRLSRVEELTGLPVTHDPDAQLRARLSMLVLMLEGRLPSLDPVERPAPPG
jgi:DNA-binding PucR family transcriptional regulator